MKLPAVTRLRKLNLVLSRRCSLGCFTLARRQALCSFNLLVSRIPSERKTLLPSLLLFTFFAPSFFPSSLLFLRTCCCCCSCSCCFSTPTLSQSVEKVTLHCHKHKSQVCFLSRRLFLRKCVSLLLIAVSPERIRMKLYTDPAE